MNKNLLTIILSSTFSIVSINTFALTVEEIDTKFEKCSENAESTTDITECIASQNQEYDLILNNIVKNKKNDQLFNNAFQKWESYVQKMGTYISQREGGTIDTINSAGFIVSEKKYMIMLANNQFWSDFSEEFETGTVKKTYDDCVESSTDNNSIMQCLNTAFASADKLINTNYKYAMNLCSDNYGEIDSDKEKNCKTLLKSAEIAWISFKDSYVAYLDANSKKEQNNINTISFKVNTTLRQATEIGPKPEGY